MVRSWLDNIYLVIQYLIPKFRQSPIISEKPGYEIWNIENFDEFQLPRI